MVEVTEKYYIGVEEDCCTVYERLWSDKRQEHYYNSVCFPRDLWGAINAIKRHIYADKLSGCDMSIGEALALLKQLNDEFIAKLDEIKRLVELK